MRSYQDKIKKFVVSHPSSAVFVKMGLGKTYAVLSALDELMYKELEVKRALVISTKRIVESVWRQESEKWGFDFKISLVAGTATQRSKALYRDADIYLLGRENTPWFVEQGIDSKFDMLIIDESTSFKNPSAKRFKAIRKLHFDRVVIMTGTPSPNGMPDLWSQFFILDKGVRLEKTVTAFRHKYLDPILVVDNVVYKYGLKLGADKVILNKIDDITIKMDNADYIDLPDIVYNNVDIPMPSKLVKMFKELRKEMIISIGDEDITAATSAALANKLTQFSSGRIYTEEKDVVEIHDLKIRALKELSETGNLLVAYAFLHEKEAILKAFPEAVVLKGQKEIDAWNAGEISLLITHPASAGHGLNLQGGGNKIVYTSPIWDYELFAQFNARLCRSGQAEDTVVINFLNLVGSMDSRIIEGVKNKKKIEDIIYD